MAQNHLMIQRFYVMFSKTSILMSTLGFISSSGFFGKPEYIDLRSKERVFQPDKITVLVC